MSISLRNIGGNALSILTSDVMNRATSFVLYAMVARHLGTFEFGQLSLAFSLFYLFQVSAVAGLKILIVRDVAKDQSQTRLYFKNGCAIVAASSFASVVLLSLFIRLMRYSPATNLARPARPPGIGRRGNAKNPRQYGLSRACGEHGNSYCA